MVGRLGSGGCHLFDLISTAGKSWQPGGREGWCQKESKNCKRLDIKCICGKNFDNQTKKEMAFPLCGKTGGESSNGWCKY